MKLDLTVLCTVAVIALFVAFLAESISNENALNHPAPIQVFVIRPGQTGEIYVAYSGSGTYYLSGQEGVVRYNGTSKSSRLPTFTTANISISAVPDTMTFSSESNTTSSETIEVTFVVNVPENATVGIYNLVGLYQCGGFLPMAIGNYSNIARSELWSYPPNTPIICPLIDLEVQILGVGGSFKIVNAS